MGHAKPQFVIRLKTAPNNLPPHHQQTYTYHWNRIFVALAALLLLVGLVVYGIYLLFQADIPPESINVVASKPEIHSESESESESTPIPLIIREDAALETTLRNLPAEKQRISEVVDNPIRPQPAAVDNRPPTMQAGGMDMDLSAQRPKQLEAAPIPETETFAHRVESGLHSIPDEAGKERTQTEESGALAVVPVHGTRKALFLLRGIIMTAASVSRFVLAKSVVNNKPVGAVEDIIPDARGVAAVYAFSDVVGIKGETLYYYWFRNSKQVSKVRVGVSANRWRSHSSKIINDKMKGEWRVELRNGKHEILASADFVYF